MSVIFPKDASIHKDFVEFGGKKIDYNNIKSIAVYVKQTTTNLSAIHIITLVWYIGIRFPFTSWLAVKQTER